MAEVVNVPAELTETTLQMLRDAVSVSAKRLHLTSPIAAIELLHANDPTAVGYFRYELAHQIAHFLMRYDRHVLGVFEEQDVPIAEGLAPPELSLYDPLRLYVLVEHDTAALHALLTALDHALVQALARRFGHRVAGYLHAIVVDQARANLLRPRAHGYRPRPALVLARESAVTTSGCSFDATRY